MSPTKIASLTPEQEVLIPVYREKWLRIALSTERLDRQKATEAVKVTYANMGFPEPDILFCNSPFAAFSTFESQLKTPLENELTNRIIWETQWWKLAVALRNQLSNQLEFDLERKLYKQRGKQLNIQFEQWLVPQSLTNAMNVYIDFDFYVSVLNCTCSRLNQKTGKAVQALVKDCGWILPFEKLCVVCDRPSKISCDSEGRPHAKGEPAIQFTDGYSLYFYHGVTIPEKYGKLHPKDWQAQWILKEDNAEVRRILIQEIGYDQIARELQATELDYWAVYTLLKIDNQADIEPIYLLKMTCPSTGLIHALRVPPDMKSAREAISWVNWGIDPEEFAVQT